MIVLLLLILMFSIINDTNNSNKYIFSKFVWILCSFLQYFTEQIIHIVTLLGKSAHQEYVTFAIIRWSSVS